MRPKSQVQFILPIGLSLRANEKNQNFMSDNSL